VNLPREQRREAERQQRHLEQAERAHDMYQAYLRGLSMAAVGQLYGISYERVRQLLFWHHLPRRDQSWRPPGDPRRADYLRRRSNSAAMSAVGTSIPSASRTSASQLGLRVPRSMSEM
jgi:hypothetical protein